MFAINNNIDVYPEVSVIPSLFYRDSVIAFPFGQRPKGSEHSEITFRSPPEGAKVKHLANLSPSPCAGSFVPQDDRDLWINSKIIT